MEDRILSGMERESRFRKFLSDERAFLHLIAKLNGVRHTDFGAYRHKCLMRRVWSRLSALGFHTWSDYLAYLDHHADEYDELLNVLTINVSEFFRNPESYAFLSAQVLPALVAQKQHLNSRVIRVWSAGCSSGEEAYSLAILFREFLGTRLDPWWVRILGTDIDLSSLKKAEEGTYPPSSLKEVPIDLLGKYFDETPQGYTVKDSLRTWVRYQNHNLVQDPPFKNIDLICCRNVFIYFNKELQLRVMRKFFEALNSGGILVFGKVESVWGELEHGFEVLSNSERVYMKK
jgi:chemotaxis methyl-accepting protein methylase